MSLWSETKPSTFILYPSLRHDIVKYYTVCVGKVSFLRTFHDNPNTNKLEKKEERMGNVLKFNNLSLFED